MDSAEEFTPQEIQEAPVHMLFWAYHKPPEERRLPISFWMQYSEEQRIIDLRASLLLWLHSGCQDLLREFQLVSTMAIMSGQDSLIDIGTGAGKMLCMILPCLTNPNSMAVVISPLERLQAVQVLVFAWYQIKTIAINEDTPNDPELWKVCILGLFFLVLGNTLRLRIFKMEYILS